MNNQVYKSSFLALLGRFFAVLFTVAIIFFLSIAGFGVLFNLLPQPEILQLIFAVLGVVTIIIAIYLTAIKNITIQVTDDAVILMRGKKITTTYLRDTHQFGSVVELEQFQRCNLKITACLLKYSKCI